MFLYWSLDREFRGLIRNIAQEFETLSHFISNSEELKKEQENLKRDIVKQKQGKSQEPDKKDEVKEGMFDVPCLYMVE